MTHAKDELDSTHFNEVIGISYIQLGKLEEGKPHINSAVKFIDKDTAGYRKYEYKYSPAITFRKLRKISWSVYLQEDTLLVNKLISQHINPCEYSVKVLEYLQIIDTSYKGIKDINLINQNCR